MWILSAAVAWKYPTSTEANVLDFAPCFIAGIVAFTLSGWFPKRLPAPLWIPFLLTLLCGFAILQGGVPEGFYNMPFQWVFCLTLGMTIPLFHDSTFAAVNYVTNHLARYSYGIYLFHCIALWVGCTVLGGLPEPFQWATALALVGVMSVSSYHFLEKPAVDFGARLAEKWA